MGQYLVSAFYEWRQGFFMQLFVLAGRERPSRPKYRMRDDVAQLCMRAEAFRRSAELIEDAARRTIRFEQADRWEGLAAKDSRKAKPRPQRKT